MGFILRGGNFREEDKSAKNAKITPTRKLPRFQYKHAFILNDCVPNKRVLLSTLYTALIFPSLI